MMQDTALAKLIRQRRFAEAITGMENGRYGKDIKKECFLSDGRVPHGAYPLHLACSMRPLPPLFFIRALLCSFPECASIAEQTWGFLPLHFACNLTPPKETSSNNNSTSNKMMITNTQQHLLLPPASDKENMAPRGSSSLVRNKSKTQNAILALRPDNDATDTTTYEDKQVHRQDLMDCSLWLAEHGELQLRVIELLLRFYPSAVRTTERFGGSLPMHIAVSTSGSSPTFRSLAESHKMIFRLLLEYWPESVNALDECGETPVDLAVRESVSSVSTSSCSSLLSWDNDDDSTAATAGKRECEEEEYRDVQLDRHSGAFPKRGKNPLLLALYDKRHNSSSYCDIWMMINIHEGKKHSVVARRPPEILEWTSQVSAVMEHRISHNARRCRGSLVRPKPILEKSEFEEEEMYVEPPPSPLFSATTVPTKVILHIGGLQRGSMRSLKTLFRPHSSSRASIEISIENPNGVKWFMSHASIKDPCAISLSNMQLEEFMQLTITIRFFLSSKKKKGHRRAVGSFEACGNELLGMKLSDRFPLKGNNGKPKGWLQFTSVHVFESA